MSSKHTAQVALSSILPGTNFSRSVYDKAHMESLKKSIMDYGLLQPVGISPSKEEPNRYDLVYGYRRFLAFTELGKGEIPVTIISEHPLSVDDRMRMNVVENNQRKDVTLMESGLRWRKLVEAGTYTVKELSYIEGVAVKKIDEVISLYKTIPNKFLKNIVANDVRADQSNLITQTKAHAIMTASKYDGITPHVEALFELVRQHNASEKEIQDVRKLIQSGLDPLPALEQTRKAKTRTMTKTLTFKVKKSKWKAFSDTYGSRMSEVVAQAIKTHDRIVLKEIAALLG